jgi:hypothetical protein
MVLSADFSRSTILPSSTYRSPGPSLPVAGSTSLPFLM